MTNTELIRQEIERRIDYERELMRNSDKKYGAHPPSCEITILALLSICGFIDSLQQEQQIGEKYAIKIGKHTHTLCIGSQSDIDDLIRPKKQEQPKMDLVAELKHHLATTPKEQLEKEWKELEPWCNIGPTVQEFLYGKQPEVDLEKEIDCWFDGSVRKNLLQGDNASLFVQIAKTARHFYKLGLNARKED